MDSFHSQLSWTGMWTVISRAEVPSTLRMPSSRPSLAAASSKRAAAESHGFFSFSIELDRNVDRDFPCRSAEHFAHAVVEAEPGGCFIETGRGGEPWILFILN